MGASLSNNGTGAPPPCSSNTSKATKPGSKWLPRSGAARRNGLNTDTRAFASGFRKSTNLAATLANMSKADAPATERIWCWLIVNPKKVTASYLAELARQESAGRYRRQAHSNSKELILLEDLQHDGPG